MAFILYSIQQKRRNEVDRRRKPFERVVVICYDYVIKRITFKFETTTTTCYRTLVNFGLLDNHAKCLI